MLKEADGKQLIIDTLEKRVGNMQNKLETSEQQQLEADTKSLRGEQVELCAILREEISVASAAADARCKLEADIEKARNWIRSKGNDLKKLSGYLPLRASKVEQDIAQHSGLEADIDSFNESNLKDILKQGHSLLKDCNAYSRTKLQALLDDLSKDYEELKKELKQKKNKPRWLIFFRDVRLSKMNWISVNDGSRKPRWQLLPSCDLPVLTFFVNNLLRYAYTSYQ